MPKDTPKEPELAKVIPLREGDPTNSGITALPSELTLTGLKYATGHRDADDVAAEQEFEEPKPWVDIGGGNPEARRNERNKREREELVDELGSHMAELEMDFNVIGNRDRFGTALFQGMNLLMKLAGDDYEGNIEQFAHHIFGPDAQFYMLRGERSNLVRNSEAKRAINSLAVLQNCIARVGPEVPASLVIEEHTRQNPSGLSGDEGGEELLDEIVKDSRTLIHNLGPKNAQAVQKFMDKLKFKVYEASKKPIRVYPTSYRKAIQGDYSAQAWQRFFSLSSSPEDPTRGIA